MMEFARSAHLGGQNAGSLSLWLRTALRALARFALDIGKKIGNGMGSIGLRSAPQARLTHLERMALGPRQVLHLVEADGMRLLIAVSPEAAPVFFALGESVLLPRSMPGESASGSVTAGPAAAGFRRTKRDTRPAPRPVALGAGLGRKGRERR